MPSKAPSRNAGQCRTCAAFTATRGSPDSESIVETTRRLLQGDLPGNQQRRHSLPGDRVGQTPQRLVASPGSRIALG